MTDTPTAKRRWLRFSLRTMLLLITALCIWLGYQVNAARRQREALAAIARAGGTVYFDRRTPPDWLHQFLGDDSRTAIKAFFSHPKPNIAKSDLDQVANFPCLRYFV